MWQVQVEQVVRVCITVSGGQNMPGGGGGQEGGVGDGVSSTSYWCMQSAKTVAARWHKPSKGEES